MDLNNSNLGPAMSLRGQQRPSNNVCVTSAITPTAARKRTFRHFAFVPTAEVNGCSLVHEVSSSNKALASCRSSVSKPPVNQL